MPSKTVYAVKSGHWSNKSGQITRTAASSSTSSLTSGTDGTNYYMAYWGWNGASLSLASSQLFSSATVTLRCGLTSHTGSGHPVYQLNRNADSIGNGDPTPYAGDHRGWLHNGYSTMSGSTVSSMVEAWVNSPINAHGVIADYPLKYNPNHSNLYAHGYAYTTITYTENTTPSVTNYTPTHGSSTTDTTPLLGARVTDPDSGQTIRTQFQVASNTSFTSNVQFFDDATTNTSPISNVGKTESVPKALTPGRWYWRARAYDGVSYSNWTAYWYFDVVSPDSPPTTPGAFTEPDGGEIIDSGITLSWGASTDPDGDPITYTVIADQIVQVWVVGSTSSTSMYVNTSTWDEGDVQFGVYATANGATSATTYSNWATIFHNTAPTISLNAPANGYSTADTTPLLGVLVTDPDSGQTLTISYQVASNTSFTSNLQSFDESTAVSTPVSNVSYQESVPTALSEGRWYWRARVYDGVAYSSWTGYRYFDVVVDDPPTTPGVFTSPTSGQVVDTSVTVAWGSSTDPDGDSITYDLDYYNGSSWSDLTTMTSTAVTHASIATQPETTTARYRVRAYSSGTSGTTQYSSYRYSSYFTVKHNTVPTITPVTANAFTTADTTPDLSVLITDPDSDQTLTTYFEIASNSSFTSNKQTQNTVTFSPVSNQQMSTSAYPALTEGRWYWRARVYDDIAYSAWTPTQHFDVTVDDPPTTPGAFTSPTSGQVVDESLTVSWGASTDPEGDPITYELVASRLSAPSGTSAVSLGTASTTTKTIDTSGWVEEDWVVSVRATANGKVSSWLYSPTFTIRHAIKNVAAGPTVISDAYLGDEQVDAMFVGTTQIWG